LIEKNVIDIITNMIMTKSQRRK